MSSPLKGIPLSHLVEVNPRDFSACNPVPYVGMEDVSEDGRLLRIGSRGQDAISPGQPTFSDGDILFAKITPCMENGKGALVSGLGGRVAQGSTEFHVLRARRGADPCFVYQWTRTPLLRRAAAAMMTGSAGQRRVPPAFFAKFEVPEFDIGEQRRIAEILDIFDERLAVTKKIVDKLRSIKLGMRNDIFQNLTAEECAIGELGQVVTGSTPPSDEAIWGDVLPFVTPAEMGDWEFVDSSPRALSSQGQGLVRKIPRGSLLAVCIGFSYGKLGVAGVDLCTNQQINSLIPRDGIYGRYLYLALGQHIERLKGLSGLQVTPIVNKRLFSSILLPVPDTLEQQRIVDRLSAVQARIDSELGEVSKLESLKHALAEDLLTGRVRVPEAEAVVESLCLP